jgi:SAM-dependent methyltransferase
VSASDPSRSFGQAALAYDRGRPDWPPKLLDALPLGSDATVLDLGAGTGKLTRLLSARYARAIAVEPDSRMRELISGADALAGTAEEIPLPHASVDGVFAAEAFHWFDGRVAVAEIARVLRPGGVLALLWNRFDSADRVLPKDVLPASITPTKHGLVKTGEWERAFDGSRFEPFREVRVEAQREVSRQDLLDFFASVSSVTALADEERRAALDRIDAALPSATYRRRWTATLFWTRLTE